MQWRSDLLVSNSSAKATISGMEKRSKNIVIVIAKEPEHHVHLVDIKGAKESDSDISMQEVGEQGTFKTNKL
jgi:hypothetical protein